MHKCFDEWLDKIREKVSESLKPNEVETLKIDWANRVFGLDNNTGSLSSWVSLPLDYSIQKTKENGEPYKNRTKSSIGFKPSYCPICGEKLED